MAGDTEFIAQLPASVKSIKQCTVDGRIGLHAATARTMAGGSDGGPD